MYYLYLITNKISNKIYIGITNDIKRRWGEHKRSSANPHLRNAIKKYGIENFKFETIAQFKSEDDACNYEIELIAKEKRKNRKNVYNIAEGGTTGRTLSPEDRKILNSRINKARSPSVKMQAIIHELYFKQHMTAKETANKLKISSGSVRGYVNRTRAKMPDSERKHLRHEHTSAVHSGIRNTNSFFRRLIK